MAFQNLLLEGLKIYLSLFQALICHILFKDYNLQSIIIYNNLIRLKKTLISKSDIFHHHKIIKFIFKNIIFHNQIKLFIVLNLIFKRFLKVPFYIIHMHLNLFQDMLGLQMKIANLNLS